MSRPASCAGRVGTALDRGLGMGAGSHEAGGLAPGVVGSARVIAFGASIVAPAASVIAGLVIVVSYAGFASPLVVLIAFVASLCCAISIAEFARRLPSAGWAYTYNSRGLGRTAGFLTGWMMIFAYALYVPAGIALTSTYASQLLADNVLHVTIAPGRCSWSSGRRWPASPTWASDLILRPTWSWSPGRWP